MTSGFFLSSPLKGKKAIVTAGPTYEPIDPVRFIGNHSTGKMGLAIAKELHQRGAVVTLILGPNQLAFSENGIELVNVTTASEMYTACIERFNNADIAIMAAAVADYSPLVAEGKKIKKTEDVLQVELTKTKDILKTLGEKKKKGQLIVGFALETNNEEAFAKEKLKSKNADLIILNSLNDKGAGFGHDTNKITIFEKSGQVFKFETQSKALVAKDIIDTIIKLYYV